MNALQALWAFLQSHGTRLLGIAQGTVALLCGMAGVIPDSHLKYWLAASAILTYWRGQTNSNVPTILPAPQPQSKVIP